MAMVHTIGGEWIYAITEKDRQDAIDAAALALVDHFPSPLDPPEPLEAATVAIDAAFKKVLRNA